MPVEEPVFLDDDHAEIAGFAEKYFDDEEERTAFMDTLMERRGYQRIVHEEWGPAEQQAPAPRQPRSRQAPPRQPAPPQQRRSPYFKR